MHRLSHSDLRALSDAMLAVYGETDQAFLPKVVVKALSELLGSEISTYNEIDHVASEFRTIHDLDSDEPEKHYPAFLAHERDFVMGRHVAQTRERRAVMMSDFLTNAQFQRTGLYNEFYRHFGVRHHIAAYMETAWGCQVCVALMRGKRDFCERDRARLTWVAPHLRQAWLNAQRFASVVSPNTDTGDQYSEKILLSAELKPLHVTEKASRLLAAFFGAELTTVSQLPQPLVLWLRSETAAAAAQQVDRPRRPLFLRRSGLTLKVWWCRRGEGGFEIVMEAEPAQVPVGLGSTGSLTAREDEVLRWMCQGKRNAEIGTILGTSPNTVRKHVQRILEKLGVETRTAAVARAIESGI